MAVEYDVLVAGNNVRLRQGFLGISSVVLVRAGATRVLFDTGGFVTRPGLIEALERRGLQPRDIGLVFLSHLHFDHSQNIDLFAGAKILVSRAEWDYATAPHEADLFMPWGICEQLERQHCALVEGEGQLEGGVTFFPLPGHTPGSYGLALDTARGKVVLAGDAIKYAKEALARRCDMAFDSTERGTRSIDRILEQADRVVPGHFPELVRQPDGTFLWEEAAHLDLVIR